MVSGSTAPSGAVGAIVNRRWRVMAVRRWSVSLASVVTVVAATVVGLAWIPASGRLGLPVEPATPRGFSLTMDTQPAVDETAGRLAEAWATAVAQVAPDRAGRRQHPNARAG